MIPAVSPQTGKALPRAFPVSGYVCLVNRGSTVPTGQIYTDRWCGENVLPADGFPLPISVINQTVVVIRPFSNFLQRISYIDTSASELVDIYEIGSNHGGGRRVFWQPRSVEMKTKLDT
jgi:hypothetical protein